MKEIMSNKKKLDAYGIISLLENCSAIIQRMLCRFLKLKTKFAVEDFSPVNFKN